MNLSRIPEELKRLPQWVLWKMHAIGDREPTKVPFQVSDEYAKAGVPETWTTFDAACNRFDAGGYLGVGFEFHDTDEFCGIDFDGCRNVDTGLVEKWAKDWIIKFDSYTEVSPSETGVKIFVRGVNPRVSGKKCNVNEAKITSKEPGVEIYDKLRYFAVTGKKLAGISATCEYRQEVIDDFCDTYFPEFVATIPKPVESSVAERAAKYVALMPAAVSGSSGHNAAFKVACVLCLGFGLDDSEAASIFAQWNQSCQPPWNDREIAHKIQSAQKQPGPRNYLRDARQEDWKRIVVPMYTQTEAKPKTELLTTEQASNKYLEQLKAGKETLVDLGLADLDHALGGGVAPGELIIIAARPSHGKSAVALQLLDTASRQARKGILISEEMSALALGKRTIQFAVDMHEDRWRWESDAVASELEHHFSTRSEIYIAESCLTADVAVATIRQAVHEHGVQIAVVDYAQLLKSSGNSQFDHVTNTSIALRRCANELGIVVVMLCQLSRDIESRDKFTPRMSDLRNSGQLEQDADVIVFIVWPYKLDNTKDKEEFLFFVAKNRNRAIDEHVVKCRFIPARQMVIQDKPPANYSNVLAQHSASNQQIDDEFR